MATEKKEKPAATVKAGNEWKARKDKKVHRLMDIEEKRHKAEMAKLKIRLNGKGAK